MHSFQAHGHARAALQETPGGVAFVLFCIFVTSYLVHLTSRVPVLGLLRFDLLLAASTALAIFIAPKPVRGESLDPASKFILAIGVYVIVTLPFVEWPGSVLKAGLEPFGKSACFYFFAVGTIKTERRLRIFLSIFVACQVFRIMEPLYLHLTEGYWGSFTHMGNWEFMDRLSGAPHDTINPNGLAFVVVTALPLLHYMIAPSGVMKKIIWLALISLSLYVLILTSSRSGFVVAIFLAAFVVYKSRHRAAVIVAMVAVLVTAFAFMSDMQRQRYFSLVDSDAKGAETAQGRVDGVFDDFNVALRKPLFGHGLGTSYEANANFRGYAQLSHNLYTEVAQELGFVGLILFLMFVRAVILNCINAQRIVTGSSGSGNSDFLKEVGSSLQILLLVYLVFSLASYGLSEPHWYLVGGLSVALARLSQNAPKASIVGAEIAGLSSGKTRVR